LKKLVVPCIIGALLLFSLSVLDECCRYKGELAAYRSQVDSLQADNAIKHEALLKAEETITQAHAAEAVALEDAVKAKRETAVAQAALAELQAQEPPTTPEIESLPIVINLRGQVARLTEMFTLSQAEGAVKDRLIVSKDTIIAAQADAMAALTVQRDNYEALWRVADGLVSKQSRFTLGEKVLTGAVGYGIGKGLEAVAKLIGGR
jgi:hypothetical protein